MLNKIQISWEELFTKVESWLETSLMHLPNIVLALLILILSYFVSKVLKRYVERIVHRFSNNHTVSSVGSRLAVAAFMVIALFAILHILQLGSAVTALLGTAGVIGLAVGLALQDPLINMFSGVIMSFREKYNHGDLVETNGYLGIIQKITLRSTIIRTPTGQEVVIPNRDVIQKPMVNYTKSGERSFELICGVSYSENLKTVEQVAIRAIENSEIPLNPDKHVEFYYQEFGNSSINFLLRFWHADTRQKAHLSAGHLAIIALKEAFDAHGITIPFPIRTLEFRQGDLDNLRGVARSAVLEPTK